MRGREERSVVKSIAVWSAFVHKQFEGLSSCESSGVSQLGFGSKIAQQRSLGETLLTFHDSRQQPRCAAAGRLHLS